MESRDTIARACTKKVNFQPETSSVGAIHEGFEWPKASCDMHVGAMAPGIDLNPTLLGTKTCFGTSTFFLFLNYLTINQTNESILVAFTLIESKEQPISSAS